MERPYDVEGLEQVKFKREAMRLEMTLPIEANERNRDNSAADSQKITSLVLTSASAKTEAHHGGVVVGTVRDGGLYLTPIDAVYQMRPSLRHLDAADSALKPRDYDREEREMQEEEERNLLPLQVQVRRRETTKQTEIRMSSHAYLRQRESEESWISLKPSMPGDDEAGALRAAVTTTRAESCGQTISAR